MSEKIVYFKDVLDTSYTMTLLEWRNQEFVRENMLNNTAITMEQHKNYLDLLEKDKTQRVFIAFFREEPVAVMTMKKRDGYIETGSYLVHEDDMGKGLGVITGYARMEYVFNVMPEGEMRTVILGHNKKNLSLQKNFGCELREVTEVTKSDGTREQLYLYTMNRNSWDKKKERILKMINRLIPCESIRWIES